MYISFQGNELGGEDWCLSREINLLSEAVRCGASKKGLPEDSTKSTASGSQLFKHVPQIAAYHNKLLDDS